MQTRVSDALDHLDGAPAGQAGQAGQPAAEGVGTVPGGKDPLMYLNGKVQQGAIQPLLHGDGFCGRTCPR